MKKYIIEENFPETWEELITCCEELNSRTKNIGIYGPQGFIKVGGITFYRSGTIDSGCYEMLIFNKEYYEIWIIIKFLAYKKEHNNGK